MDEWLERKLELLNFLFYMIFEVWVCGNTHTQTHTHTLFVHFSVFKTLKFLSLHVLDRHSNESLHTSSLKKNRFLRVKAMQEEFYLSSESRDKITIPSVISLQEWIKKKCVGPVCPPTHRCTEVCAHSLKLK